MITLPFIIFCVFLFSGSGASAQRPDPGTDVSNEIDAAKHMREIDAMPLLDQYKAQDFPETRRLQSFAARALLACQTYEKLAVTIKEYYLTVHEPKDLERAMGAHRETEICVEQAQKFAPAKFKRSQAEIQKRRPAAMEKLKAYFATWLSVMRGMPRDAKSSTLLDAQCAADTRLVVGKESELDVEIQ